jgi:hypothetical protein
VGHTPLLLSLDGTRSSAVLSRRPRGATLCRRSYKRITVYRVIGGRKGTSAVKVSSTRFSSIMALVVDGAAHVSTAVAVEDWEQDWTVVTMARDGSWGIGIGPHIADAYTAAIRECRAMSSGGSDCGAEFAAIRGGWIIGLRCDDYRILVAAKELKDAEVAALDREIDLKQLYVPDLPACHRVLTVDPRAAVTTSSPRFSERPQLKGPSHR